MDPTSQPPLDAVDLPSEVDFTGPKNGEDCDACKRNPRGVCLFHWGYDLGWAAARQMDPPAPETPVDL